MSNGNHSGRAALESVRPLLIRLADRQAVRSGLDRDDLFMEACLVFLGGVSGSRVRQIQRRALGRLETTMRRKAS